LRSPSAFSSSVRPFAALPSHHVDRSRSSGKGEAVEAMLESLKVISEPLRSFATILVECCAYAGTGNVLKVQHMLHICSEHFDQKEEKKVRRGADQLSVGQHANGSDFSLGRRKRIVERQRQGQEERRRSSVTQFSPSR
jgi:hypothetical protein